MDRLLSAQSRELDRDKRRKIVWDIERILVEDAARPVILHSSAGNCWQPYVKGYHPHDNSQYNNLRFEDVWLDRVIRLVIARERSGEPQSISAGCKLWIRGFACGHPA